jgi:hypothetical protein
MQEIIVGIDNLVIYDLKTKNIVLVISNINIHGVKKANTTIFINGNLSWSNK